MSKPREQVDQQPAPTASALTPYQIWYMETRNRLERFLCDDAHLIAQAERSAVVKAYEERFQGRQWTVREIKEVSAQYGRSLSDEQRAKLDRTINLLMCKRDEIAERIRHDSWEHLREKVMRHKDTLTELAGIQWIKYMPPLERKPTDEAGMQERMRMAEETARRI